MQPISSAKKWLYFLSLFFLTLPMMGMGEKDPFHYEYNLSTQDLRPGESLPITFQFYIPDKYFLYRDKIEIQVLQPLTFSIENEIFSPSTKITDKFFKKVLDVYLNTATLQITLRIPKEVKSHENLKLFLTYQGCSEDLCYPAQKQEIEIPLHFQGVETSPTPSAPVRQWGVKSLLNFTDLGFLTALLLVFLGGIATSFTPCVLPLIPLTLAFIWAQGGGTRLRHHFLVFVLVLSMAFTYALLGYLAATFGWSLGFIFQNIYFIMAIVVLYGTLALSLFGFYQIQMPFRVRQWLSGLGGKGILGAVISGFSLGFLAAPCVGPIIAALLLYVAQSGNPLYGFLLLFVFGMGMGVIFFVMNIFYDSLSTRLKAKRWTLFLERGLGVLLLLPALYYGSIAYQHFVPSKNSIFVQEASFWIRNPEEAFATARSENKPLMIDFFATWCLPCLEMEKTVYSHPGIQEKLKDFVALKVDCTEETAVCQSMVKRFNVVGWPTILFLSPEGVVIDQYSLIGKQLGSDEMLNHLNQVLRGLPQFLE